MIFTFYMEEFFPLKILRAARILEIKLQLVEMFHMQVERMELEYNEQSLKVYQSVVDYQILIEEYLLALGKFSFG